jgi:hypothetical protein
MLYAVGCAGCAVTRVVVIDPPDECPSEIADAERLARDLVLYEPSSEAGIEQDRMVQRYLDAGAFCRVARGE